MLTQLGSKSEIPESPITAILEKIDNKHPETLFCARFQCPEWTGLCPVTGQPDFGKIIIDYVPEHYLVESKSLKLFLCSFRNHGCFHEEVIKTIFNKIGNEVNPLWLRVSGFFYPRGGIPIDVFVQNENPPEGVYIPPFDLNPFNGRP